DDVTFGRIAGEIEGVTGDERHARNFRRREHVHVGGFDDAYLDDSIAKDLRVDFQEDFCIDVQGLESSEESVPVSRDPDVAGSARRRGAFDVRGAAVQVELAGAGV